LLSAQQVVVPGQQQSESDHLKEGRICLIYYKILYILKNMSVYIVLLHADQPTQDWQTVTTNEQGDAFLPTAS
jgi:hypothetical protein